MARFLVRRLALALVTLLSVAVVVFILVRLTGDPVRLMLVGTGATAEDVESLRRELGYDKPLLVQFLRFIAGAIRGDLGLSLRYRVAAAGLVLDRIPATIELAVSAMFIAIAVGVPLGILAAVYRGTLLDGLSTTVGLVGQSIPLFWLGISLVLLFAVKLGWVPASGRGSVSQLLLPSLTLATYPMGRTVRMVRSALLEVLRRDYVRTARAKGLMERKVIYLHALRNALLPVVTLLSLQFGALLGGAVVTESIFAWPGLGLLVLDAVTQRDLPLVQAVVLVVGSMFIGVNVAVDILYGYLDPRIRWQ